MIKTVIINHKTDFLCHHCTTWGRGSLLGHQATSRPQPRQTQPIQTKSRRTKPNHTKNPPRTTFIFAPFSAAEPRRTPPNPAKPDQTSRCYCFSSSMCWWTPRTIFYFCPFFGRRTKPNQTEPNEPTEPNRTISPQAELATTGAGCFPGAASLAEPKKTDFVV